MVADTGNFIQFVRERVSLVGSNNIILFGDDFGGSLAIWAELNYPDLIDGVIAYGPPLEARVAFPEYLTVGLETVSAETPLCAPIYNGAFSQIADLIAAGEGEQLQAYFNLVSPVETDNWRDVGIFYYVILEILSTIHVFAE